MAAPNLELCERLFVVALSLGPAAPIGLVLMSAGRFTFSPTIALSAMAGGLGAALLSSLDAFLLPAISKLPPGAGHAFGMAFGGAAFGEELFKLTMLLIVLLRRSDTDVRRDAILAGAFIGLGFALFENFLYVAGNHHWAQTGLERAALAVPGHVVWGMVMGYFVQRAMDGGDSLLFAPLAYLAPMMLHGLYDGFAMLPAEFKTHDLNGVVIGAFVGLTIVLCLASWAAGVVIADTLSGNQRMEPAYGVLTKNAAYDLHAAASWSAVVLLLAAIGAALTALILAAVLDIRYFAIAATAILPLAFVEIWRRT